MVRGEWYDEALGLAVGIAAPFRQPIRSSTQSTTHSPTWCPARVPTIWDLDLPFRRDGGRGSRFRNLCGEKAAGGYTVL